VCKNCQKELFLIKLLQKLNGTVFFTQIVVEQSTDSFTLGSTTNDNEMTSETVRTTPVTVATSDVVTSSTAVLSAAVSTSNQLITSDVSSSLIQSVTTGDEATTSDLTTTTDETTTTTTTTKTTTKPDATTAEIITTNAPDATSTRQKTTTSEQRSSGLTTVEQTTVTSSSPPDVHCCCRCCFPSTNACKVCDGDTLTDAFKCANEKLKTIKPVDRNTPKFEPPAALKGSQHPERLALRDDFVKMEQLTENLASLSESQRIELGFTSSDLIVDCLYNGMPCSVEQLVEIFPFCAHECICFYYSVLLF